MKEEPEYAPQYTTRERWKHAIVGVASFAVLWVVCEWWVFPAWRDFSRVAHCRIILGVSGTSIVMYGLFVGLPLFIAAALAAISLPTALRSIRERRYPPLGQKVRGKVKVRTGRVGVVLAFYDIAVLLPFVLIAVWGGFKAGEIIRSSTDKTSQHCEAQRTEHETATNAMQATRENARA